MFRLCQIRNFNLCTDNPHSKTSPPQPLTKPSDVQDPNVVAGALEGEALVDPFNDVAEELSVEGLCQSIPGTGRLVRFQGDTGSRGGEWRRESVGGGGVEA